MTINRANQTWPEDVTACCRCLNAECICGDPAFEAEPEDEFERRQRGSASTIAALFVVALFAVCAIAVFPMLAALANVAK